MSKELIGKYKQVLEKQMEAFNELCKKYCSNKTIPLDERWNTFTELDLGIEKPYITRFQSINMDSFFNDYEFQKYSTIYIEDIIDWLYEVDDNPDQPGDNRRRMGRETLMPGKTINDLKEEILSKYIKEFRFDW